MTLSRWTHADRTARNRKGRFHRVDPHYEGRKVPVVSGRLVYWTCYVCRGEVQLGGQDVPIIPPVQRGKPHLEAAMSAQP